MDPPGIEVTQTKLGDSNEAGWCHEAVGFASRYGWGLGGRKADHALDVEMQVVVLAVIQTCPDTPNSPTGPSKPFKTGIGSGPYPSRGFGYGS